MGSFSVLTLDVMQIYAPARQFGTWSKDYTPRTGESPSGFCNDDKPRHTRALCFMRFISGKIYPSEIFTFFFVRDFT